MKILVVSDKIVERLRTPSGSDALREVDLIVSCGDLRYDYLEYLLTIANAPLCYVHGNHDRPMLRESGAIVAEPEGATNLHGKAIAVRVRSGARVLLAGLEGTHRCGIEGRWTSEFGMSVRVLRLLPRLLWYRMRTGRFLDILVTHAPPAGIHEGDDPCHRGFRALRRLIRWARPALALHGHIHPSYGVDVRPVKFGPTRVLNVYGSMVLEVDDARS